MSARKKATAKVEDSKAGDANELEAASKSDTAVEPVATKAGVPTYRTDLGESLPPQKKPGVE